MSIDELKKFIGSFKENIGLEKWNLEHIPTCNTYSTTVIRALGIKDISHWFGSDGIPQYNEGREYEAKDMLNWLNTHGEDYGWIDTTQMSYDERLALLKNGYIFYGATDVHTWVVFGVETEKGEVVPVLTQSTFNRLFEYPDKAYKFFNPAEGMVENNGILWAHPLPGVESQINQ